MNLTRMYCFRWNELIKYCITPKLDKASKVNL